MMALAISSALLVPALAVGTVSAQTSIQENLCQGGEIGTPGQTSGCSSTSGAAEGVQGAATDIVNLLSWVVGIVSVIMIIVGGFRYITSGGASDKVTGAKNTIIYAVIGLIIVALAQFIVNFVLAKAIEVEG